MALSGDTTGFATAANQTGVQQTIGSTKFLRQLLSNAQGAQVGMAAYHAVGTAYTAYATPIDMLCLNGSASKIVLVTAMWMQIHSTAAALQTIYFIKRSAANTGGVSTNPAGLAYDSAQAAASAVVSLYTSAPTPGASAGNLRIAEVLSGTLTAAGGQVSLASITGMAMPLQVGIDVRAGVVLRGVAESLCANYNGAALPAGFTSTWGVEWVEFTAP